MCKVLIPCEVQKCAIWIELRSSQKCLSCLKLKKLAVELKFDLNMNLKKHLVLPEKLWENISFRIHGTKN
jgi:hypothetical protein